MEILFSEGYFVDSVALGLSLVPFVLVLALIVASMFEEPLKARVTVSTRR